MLWSFNIIHSIKCDKFHYNYCIGNHELFLGLLFQLRFFMSSMTISPENGSEALVSANTDSEYK